MWPLRRRKKSASGIEAEKALREADKTLNEIQRRGCEVRQISEALKDIRQRNHFAEALEEIILGQHGRRQQ